ncbi:hypothetical protein ACB098_08G015900 [Castanea mollissima]|uniref:Uncharacterized protein n=1 Tax=Castanea mollissima TaxID=60419 RepID=A0A8J4QD75_9ROSI|nr:hypothetical protein CMV_028844 [Castanea mollissima]
MVGLKPPSQPWIKLEEHIWVKSVRWNALIALRNCVVPATAIALQEGMGGPAFAIVRVHLELAIENPVWCLFNSYTQLWHAVVIWC